MIIRSSIAKFFIWKQLTASDLKRGEKYINPLGCPGFGSPQPSPSTANFKRYTTMYRLTIFLAVTLFPLHVYAATNNGTEHRAAHRRRLDRREADFEAFKQDVVNSHNSARSGFGPAPQVTWSDELYPDTHAYASECRFEHRCVELRT